MIAGDIRQPAADADPLAYAYVYVAQGDGMTGETEPDWDYSSPGGSTTSDREVTWLCVEPTTLARALASLQYMMAHPLAAGDVIEVNGTEDATILIQPGGYNLTTALADAFNAGNAAGYSSGQTAQLTTDRIAVDAVKSSILDTVENLLGTVNGGFDLSLYKPLETATPAGGTTAAGPLMLPLKYLRDTIAASDTFQDWTFSGNAAAASAHVHYAALPVPAAGREHTLAELQGYRPFAIIGQHSDGGYHTVADAVTSGNEFYEGGVLRVVIEADVAPAVIDDYAEVEIQFLNKVGGVVSEIKALAGTAGYLNIRRISVHGPWRNNEAERLKEGDAIFALLLIEWGMGR
ncbi:MAG: hypothetical protein IMZ55_00650 [Acidobacteria bacterium]|nr:hypothetical protein [Acidobacteriota bacterium]